MYDFISSMLFSLSKTLLCLQIAWRGHINLQALQVKVSKHYC